jgi:hypothetical protein
MRNPYRGVAIVGAYNTKQVKRFEGMTEASLVRRNGLAGGPPGPESPIPA